ncbi:MAG: non-heme iron oxygenase ferredoxin subunit [Actinomycetia bacterium]|nr:non-heme iron oxygenase ferredoxin subunit [Actinomycetes bacterium]MCP4958822.1 non-heme iron oxygenase ferredoxin subunit [Actinomycetes bacterium]
MNRSVRLCELGALDDGAVTRVDIDGQRIAVARVGQTVYAIGDRCSHANFSLSDGFLSAGDCTIECPKHGSRFSLVTGVPDSLPAVRAVPVYEVRVDGDDVIAELPEDDR